jgi:bifunctional DNA-binding transcriptional regulator/antitoxin component of YhaV-PrlF toxin-antitoxin module
MITDTGLQIFGGYGFIEEYPLARQYRDNRIQRIWEGTNEINRMIITGFMMKKALMEELTLREFMEDLDAFLETEIEDVIVSTLGYEAKAIEALKRLAALVFHEALCEYGQDLKHEQQLANLIADMFTLIYTAEATVCRVSQTVGSNGQAAIPIEIAKVFTVETGQEISTKVKNALNRIFKGSVPKRISEVVTKLERSLDRETDIIELKQHIADYVYKEKKYPL